jgi:hypothetical protein
MLSQLTRYAKNLWARLSSATNQLFLRITKPARPNLVTGALADLSCSRAELLLKEYVTYFNQARPHQGITQRIPAPTVWNSIRFTPDRCSDDKGA